MNATEILVPGDKSISHRAVLYAALADGTSRLDHLATGHDVASTISCVRALGVSCVEQKNGTLIVHGKGLRGWTKPEGPLDCGNSGTTMRLLSGILAGQTFVTDVTGDESLRRRPMGRVMDPLRQMGAEFSGGQGGRAPFTIHGKENLTSIDYALPVASAQVKSAVLLAGLYASGVTRVRESQATRDHTERLFNISVQDQQGSRISSISPPMRLEPLHFRIPGDPSSAAFVIIAALLLKREMTVIRRVSINPTRIAFIKVLLGSGARIDIEHASEVHGEPVADLVVHRSDFHGHVDLRTDIPLLIDEIPALAIFAACSDMPFSIRNAQELRHKESDRISLLVRNLRALGCEVEEETDGFASLPKNGLIGALIETHQDHRIAMAFGVASLFVKNVSIDDPSCVDVSFPGFWNMLKDLRP